MRYSLSAAGAAALFLTIFSLVGPTGSSSAAGAQTAALTEITPTAADPAALPAGAPADPRLDNEALPQDDTNLALPPASSLAALVDAHDDDASAALDDESRCLATAIFYEARSESLAGKLAVARVIVNRSRSGRFPTSLCGVVTQPGQFSFVRGGQMPSVPTTAASWDDCVAIARIAKANSWKSPAEGALYFHASRVAPRWGRVMLARVDNHLFYR